MALKNIDNAPSEIHLGCANMSCVRSVFSLLLTTAFLLTGHGIHMTFLPLMASDIGLSQTVIGFSGSAYFAGFISGAMVTPHIIAK